MCFFNLCEISDYVDVFVHVGVGFIDNVMNTCRALGRGHDWIYECKCMRAWGWSSNSTSSNISGTKSV